LPKYEQGTHIIQIDSLCFNVVAMFWIGQMRKNEISLPKWFGGTQSHRHGGGFGGFGPPQTNLQAHQFEVLNTTN